MSTNPDPLEAAVRYAEWWTKAVTDMYPPAADDPCPADWIAYKIQQLAELSARPCPHDAACRGWAEDGPHCAIHAPRVLAPPGSPVDREIAWEHFLNEDVPRTYRSAVERGEDDPAWYGWRY